MPALLETTRTQDPGCIDCDQRQGHADPGPFIFHENWTSDARLDGASRSRARAWGECGEAGARGREPHGADGLQQRLLRRPLAPAGETHVARPLALGAIALLALGAKPWSAARRVSSRARARA